jgi:hypothetical protein
MSTLADIKFSLQPVQFKSHFIGLIRNHIECQEYLANSISPAYINTYSYAYIVN